ncbi:MAG TPA: hypothetical protein VFW28_14160 [Micropepsaceae bacterium]|nr:hypothetical protein [Micropepsaceae bacterium]
MMRVLALATVSCAVLLTGTVTAQNAQPQVTIFTTKDFHKDRALWANPAYYRNNTAAQLQGMALNIVPYETGGQVGGARLYGSQGTGKPGTTDLGSPYPFKTATEQYEAWLKEAHGGTKHTAADLPDWSGIWMGGGGGRRAGGAVSDTIKFLKPEYQEYYVQEMKAASEGRSWGPSAFCLPDGFFGALNAQEFVVTPKVVYTIGANANDTNNIRWIYINAPHTAEDKQFPKWHGESIGFWNGDTLIVHTNQIRAWKGGPGGEFTNDLETAEKYQRVGDAIQGEVTIYDPNVFTGPVYEKLNFRLSKKNRPEDRPLFNTCTDTNGPSPKVYLDAKGFLNEHLVGEGEFTWDVADQRPWGTWLDESDKRYRAYLAAGGKPPVMADKTPTPDKLPARAGK